MASATSTHSSSTTEAATSAKTASAAETVSTTGGRASIDSTWTDTGEGAGTRTSVRARLPETTEVATVRSGWREGRIAIVNTWRLGRIATVNTRRKSRITARESSATIAAIS